MYVGILNAAGERISHPAQGLEWSSVGPSHFSVVVNERTGATRRYTAEDFTEPVTVTAYAPTGWSEYDTTIKLVPDGAAGQTGRKDSK